MLRSPLIKHCSEDTNTLEPPSTSFPSKTQLLSAHLLSRQAMSFSNSNSTSKHFSQSWIRGQSLHNIFGVFPRPETPDCEIVYSRDYLTPNIWQTELWFARSKLSMWQKIILFGLKIMMKSGLEKIILKFLHAQAIFY